MKLWAITFGALACLCLGTSVWAQPLNIVTLNSAPLAYEQNGEVVGLAADLVREGLKRMGHEANILIVPWKRALHMVRYGQADALFPAGYNEDRAQWYHYPPTHLFEVRAVPIKRLDDPLDFSLDRLDYSEHTLGDVRGGYFGPNHKKFRESARFKDIEEISSTPPNFNKLAERRIDLFITTYHEAKHLIRTMGLADSIGIVKGKDGTPLYIDRSKVHLAFSRQRHAPGIAEKFAQAIQSMREDGTYARITKKHLDP